MNDKITGVDLAEAFICGGLSVIFFEAIIIGIVFLFFNTPAKHKLFIDNKFVCTGELKSKSFYCDDGRTYHSLINFETKEIKNAK